jgi:integrase
MSSKFNFTKRALDALPAPPTGRRAYHYDSAIPGLGLSVTDTGTKSFIHYRWIKGRGPERITLGRYPGMTVEQARKEAGKINGAIAHGKNPADDIRARRGDWSVKQLFGDYLEHHAKLHTKTWAETDANFRRYLEPFAARKVSQLRAVEIQRWHAKLGEERGRYAANRAAELLRAVINWGLKTRRVDRTRLEGAENPAKDITPFQERARARFLQADELPRFFRAVADEPNEAVRDYVLLSLLTGARKRNVLAMRWDALNLEQATWHIPETKNGEALTIPLTPEAVAILRVRDNHRNGDYVFPGSGKTGYLQEPKKGWQRILKRVELYHLIESVGKARRWTPKQVEAARINALEDEAASLEHYRTEATALKLDTSKAVLKDLRIHDLRRTLGSWQAATGASLSVIGKSLGHKDMASTMVYARLDLDPVRQSMQKATAALYVAGGLAKPAEVTRLPRKRQAR